MTGCPSKNKENKNLTLGERWSASKQQGPGVVSNIHINIIWSAQKKNRKKKTVSFGYNVHLSKLWKMIYLSNWSEFAWPELKLEQETSLFDTVWTSAFEP